MSCAKKQFNIVKNILNHTIFSENIVELILIQYWKFLPKQLILLDWININYLDWSSLCENKNAIHLLQENQSKINACHSQILEFVKEKKIEIVDR